MGTVDKQGRDYSARAATNLALTTRLFGVLITVFILILTVKSELLDNLWITLQLVSAMPITFVSMVIGSKIHDDKSFQKYRILNLIVSSVSVSLIFNSLGLLVTKYISITAGAIFFVILLVSYGMIFAIERKHRKIYNEAIIISMLILLGLYPALRFL